MTYEVIRFFTDLQDNDYPYNVGDTFPRKGMSVSDARIKELLSPDNKQGVPLIKGVPDDKQEQKPSGNKRGRKPSVR